MARSRKRGSTSTRSTRSLATPTEGRRLAVLVLGFAACSAALAQPRALNIQSARIEKVVAFPDKSSLHVTLKNTGERPITAFSIAFHLPQPNGEAIPCGGRGMDMIDWSDPMPGRGLYVHMRRNWIPPNGTAMLDGYPRCPGVEGAPLESIQAELSLIVFEDGSGEGDRRQIETTLRWRQAARNERVKWIDRFTALRSATDLRVTARSLYQDLVDATRSAEIDPEQAARQGMAKPVREELQALALDVAEWASRNEPLVKNELLVWRITDVEQRTTRLIRGCGTTDVSPY